jgi:hypothetical protein
MIAQAAIANPRIFTPHTPSVQERYQVIMRHLYLTVAYELRREKERPDMLEDTTINKTYLHALKHYDPNSDDSFELPELQPHNYTVTMPTLSELNKIAQSLETVKDNAELPLERTHSVIEFRKYLFNYIK